MTLRTSVPRIFFAAAYVTWVFAMTSPLAGGTTDPTSLINSTSGTVSGAVQTVSNTVSGTVTTVENTTAPVKQEVQAATGTVGSTVASTVEGTTGNTGGGSVASSIAAPSGSGGTAQVANTDGTSSAIAGTASGTQAQGRDGGRGVARKGPRSKGTVTAGSAKAGDDLDAVLGAGNDVVTIALLGDSLAPTEKQPVKPAPSRSAPLALTGGSILFGLFAGLVLILTGTATGSASKMRRPLLA